MSLKKRNNMSNPSYYKPVKPSMARRCSVHDYTSRCFYLVTTTVVNRQPLLGRLVGNSQAETPDGRPSIVLSPLGEAVLSSWLKLPDYYGTVSVVAAQVMPDHFHGIIFFKENSDLHLGYVMRGFKTGCNRAYRELVQGTSVTHSDALLWNKGYNDRILTHYEMLDKWKRYLAENPLRLALKREHPDLFRVQFGAHVAGHQVNAIGNRFLLDYPDKLAVKCSRSLGELEIKEQVSYYLEKGKQGSVLVSPSISPGEKAVMRAALEAQLPIIHIDSQGFNSYTKPGGQFFEACAAGHLLIVSPWEHSTRKQMLTREQCLIMNGLAAAICAT